MQRDIALLKDEGLVRIEDGAVVPNLELMERFTALQEIQELQKHRQAEARKVEMGHGRKRV